MGGYAPLSPPAKLTKQTPRSFSSLDLDLVRLRCSLAPFCRSFLLMQVGALGIATAMQVLLGAEGRGGDSSRLHRVEIAALITTLGKFASAIQIVSEFEERRSSMGEE